jgi:CheY-like chemotaxis protein
MSLEQLKILLADDDTDDCYFFKVALGECKIATQFTVVNDGEQLMKLLASKSKSSQLPHIIFIDINMPRKNGFECLTEIKESKKLKQLPVIMYSTSFEQEVVNLLYNNGAHYFIRKPPEFSQFKKIIHQTLALIVKEFPNNQTSFISQPTRENFVLTVQN